MIIMICTIVSSCARTSLGVHAAEQAGASSRTPDAVRKGDLVTLNVTAMLSSGALIFTTDPLLASNDGATKAPGYSEPDCFAPLKILAGEEGPVPGLKDILVSMYAGEKRTITLPPEKAYGVQDKNLIKQLDCVKVISKKVTMKPDEYMMRFNSFPVVGAKVDLNPYFPAKVTKVSAQQTELVNLAKDGTSKDGPFGKTEIRVKGDEIRITLTPTIGADFEILGKKGTIVSTDGKTFSVDLNKPLAGMNVALDIEVLSSTPRAALDAIQIPWADDYNAGLTRAEKENKPVVLVLYASWCQWSKKYFEETLSDPKIKAMKDKFVWVKIDSDKNKEYYTKYQQNGFPLTVLMSHDGTVMNKSSGFMDSSRMVQKLICVSQGKAMKKETVPADVLPQKQEQGCMGQ
jgi:FKBP-type peptidyl-prolyl cis-trans isomerase 2